MTKWWRISFPIGRRASVNWPPGIEQTEVDLGTITSQITQKPSLEESDVRPLLPNIDPGISLEARNAGPVVYLVLVHSVQQQVQ